MSVNVWIVSSSASVAVLRYVERRWTVSYWYARPLLQTLLHTHCWMQGSQSSLQTATVHEPPHKPATSRHAAAAVARTFQLDRRPSMRTILPGVRFGRRASGAGEDLVEAVRDLGRDLDLERAPRAGELRGRSGTDDRGG